MMLSPQHSSECTDTGAQLEECSASSQWFYMIATTDLYNASGYVQCIILTEFHKFLLYTSSAPVGLSHVISRCRRAEEH